jgi:hypothetical protein
MRKHSISLLALLLVTALTAFAEAPIRVRVDFSSHVRDWDGFGVNYVETAQTRDYDKDPQEYGGFSRLTEKERQEIMDMIFGEDGLKPGLLKMFYDPWHEPENDNDDPRQIDMSRFDHETTTRWMRYFAKDGLKRTRARGSDLTFITTLYGPPAWTTKQKFVRGRDLDPAMKEEVAEYLISWVKYLRETEQIPMKYISLHNEGEDFVRWPEDGSTWDRLSHDYNMFWPPEQVVDFLKFMRGMLDEQGLEDVGLAPGETSNWYRFNEWGYAHAIASDPVAMKNLGLITSHGFISFGRSRWFGDWRSRGVDTLRAKNPDLHAWVTSQSWSKMDAFFAHEIRGNIYATGCNGIIPWACIQTNTWVGGDPNPGTAFFVNDDGDYEVKPGYYFYKQVSRAGQPGMAVAHVESMDSEVSLMAFSKNGTSNPNALVVINISDKSKPLAIHVIGSSKPGFDTYRTSDEDRYSSLGPLSAHGGVVSYTAPGNSVTTFFEK